MPPTADGLDEETLYTVRVAVWDDTEKNPVHPRAEIWFRGDGSWWLTRELEHGATTKELGPVPSGTEHTLSIYSESRDGKELEVPFVMTEAMNPKGSVRDTITVEISDTEVVVRGLPIEAATGEVELRHPRM